MNDNDLLNKFTELLAFAGDENSKNGHPNVSSRNTPLTDAELGRLVNTVKEFLNMPSDITTKVYDLKGVFDNASESQKGELTNYINEYEVNPMQGGKRSLKSRSKKSKSRSVKRRSSKTRKF